MDSRDIYITKFDFARLRELLRVGISFKKRDRDYLERLQHELDRAHIVDPTAIPHNVVTMNSRVCLKEMETGKENTYTLVFPSDAEIGQKKNRFLRRSGPPFWAIELVTPWTRWCRLENASSEFKAFSISLKQPAAMISKINGRDTL